MIYLASPYSHPDRRVCQSRFDAACRKTAEIMRTGRLVFSPVVHGHPLVRFGVPGDWMYWESFARHQLRWCDELVVLMLDGWEESHGVQAEIRMARELGKPQAFVSLNMLANVARKQ